MLPSMAAGLGSILFATTIDNPVFNSSPDPFEKSRLDEAAILASVKKTTQTSNDASVDDKVGVARKKRKPKPKSSAKIVDFDETDVGKMREYREARVSASDDARSETSSAVSSSKVVDNNKVSPTPSLSFDPVRLKDSKQSTLTRKSTSKSVDTENDEDLDVFSRSSVSDFDQSGSLNTTDSKLGSLSKLTPVRNVEIGALIPLTANGDLRHDDQVLVVTIRPQLESQLKVILYSEK